MSRDEVMDYYTAYLEDKLSSGIISKGAFKLLKISESAFDDYYRLFEDSQLYRQKQLEIHKAWSRDKKISQILDERTNRDN